MAEMLQEVTDPAKVVTDKLVLRRLAEQGIDSNYVELWHDYAPRSKGREYSPYAKFYRDLKSGKKIMAVSGLPKVKALGHKIEIGWLYAKKKYYSKANLFSAIVDGEQVQLTCLSDQPNGAKKSDRVIWNPQLYLNNVEQSCDKVALLDTDPTNENYHQNVLEWDYGVCKRRIRVIEGRIRERWVFAQNPEADVRIKHNPNGNLGLKLGSIADAKGMHLRATVISDEEIIKASEFDKAVFPVEIGAGATFYPDAHEETSSVDGYILHQDLEADWATIRGGAGTAAYDDSDYHAVSLYTYTSGYQYIERSIILFDTSALGAGATVSAATYSQYGTHKLDDLVANDINIYSSDPASNVALEAGDYNSLGTTPYCDTAITHANWKITSPYWNDWVFNATGIAAIVVDGVTKLGAREATHDAGNSEPDYIASKNSYLQGYSSDKGAGYKPKLVITYTVAVDVTIEPPLATVASLGLAPSLVRDVIFSAPLTTIDSTALAPTFIQDTTVLATLATIDTVGLAPSLVRDCIFSVPLATIDTTALTPTLSLGITLFPPLTTIDSTALIPSIGLGITISPPVATVDMTGLTPTMIVIWRGPVYISTKTPIMAGGPTPPRPFGGDLHRGYSLESYLRQLQIRHR